MFGINGLLYIPHYVTNALQHTLIQTIDQQPWRDDLSRRTQHYGYIYDCRAKRINSSSYLGPLPDWLYAITQVLLLDRPSMQKLDQAIINEYHPDQGIAAHIDCKPCFESTVISLSLGGSVVMDLKRNDQHIPLLLEPGSILVLNGEARYEWTHGIPRRKKDMLPNGISFQRERRLSITFRTVITDQ